MQKIKNILVPTDFSPHANAATAVATDLGQRTKTRLHFLHQMTIPFDWDRISAKKGQQYSELIPQIERSRRILNLVKQKAQNTGLKAQDYLVFTQQTDDFVRHTLSIPHELIVMGSRGASGLRETFIGSNAQKVLRKSEVPVLIIKKPNAEWQPKNLVFVSDFNEDISTPFLVVQWLADIYKAGIHLLYVNTPGDFEETPAVVRRIEAFITKTGARQVPYTVYNAKKKEEGIAGFAGSLTSPVIAMVKSRRRKGIFATSLLEIVANRSEFPILCIQQSTAD